MAPACGVGPSNWNCLLETMEPILFFESFKTPFSKVIAKSFSVLQVAFFATGPAAQALEEADGMEEVSEEMDLYEKDEEEVIGT